MIIIDQLQTCAHIAILLLTNLKTLSFALTYLAIILLKCGIKRNTGNVRRAWDTLLAKSSMSDISCWKAGSQWSNRRPKDMLMMTFATHDIISCLTSKGRPCFSRTLFIISSASIKILDSITLWPNPNRFMMDRHNLWWLLKLAL